jgi:hypothetical protein
MGIWTKVREAFNQTGFQNMANPKFSSGNAVMFVCGDDLSGKKIVLQLPMSRERSIAPGQPILVDRKPCSLQP